MKLNSFWFDQGKWPKDTAQWTFLARAHNQIGKTLFDELWTGKEPIERQPPLLDYLIRARTGQKIYAHTLLNKHRKDFKRKPLKRQGVSYVVPAFTETQWYAATKLARKLHNEGKPAQERLHRVRNEIASQCESEKLRSGSRAIEGGAIEPMLPELWNSERERLTVRFEHCQINLNQPFGLGIAGEKYRWIFIATDSLKSFLKTLGKRQPAEAVKKTAGQETRCTNWLIEEMRSHKDPPKPKTEYRKEAKHEFLVSTRAFDRAWASAIKATGQHNWSNSGRKTKSKQIIDTPSAN